MTKMDNSRLVKISKYLSKHLRHQPDRLGIKLALGGWVAVDELLAACAKHSFPISAADLNEVVAQNDKQRFSFDTGTLIRANQGHSVEVNLLLQPAIPLNVLYHGTGQSAVQLIIQNGLCKMSRESSAFLSPCGESFGENSSSRNLSFGKQLANPKGITYIYQQI